LPAHDLCLLRMSARAKMRHIKSCQHCGSTKRLEVHHIKYDRDSASLIKVCHRCHHRIFHSDHRLVQQHPNLYEPVVVENL
jgi:hypothetical protein